MALKHYFHYSFTHQQPLICPFLFCIFIVCWFLHWSKSAFSSFSSLRSTIVKNSLGVFANNKSSHSSEIHMLYRTQSTFELTLPQIYVALISRVLTRKLDFVILNDRIQTTDKMAHNSMVTCFELICGK